MSHAPQTPAVRAFASDTHLLSTAAALPAPGIETAQAESAAEVSGLFQAAVARVGRLAATNAQLAAIAIGDPAELINSWDGPADRLLLAEREPAAALSWCAQLAVAGSHPVVITSAEVVRDHLPTFRRQFADFRAGLTLLVRAAKEQAISPDEVDCDLLRVVRCGQVLCPASLEELSLMLSWSCSSTRLTAIWLPEEPISKSLPYPVEPIERGQSQLLASGQDVGIVALGPTVPVALGASALLSRQGIRAAVLNARFADPLDESALLQMATAAGRIVVLESEYDRAGFGRRVVELFAKRTNTVNVQVIDLIGCDSERPDKAAERCVAEIVARCAGAGASEHARRAGMNGYPDRVADVTANASQFEGWLADLTDEQRQVLDYEPSSTIAAWIDRYEAVGKRGVYLWKWCLHGLELIALPCIAPELRDDLRDTKLLAVMLGVMLDDVADQAVDDEFLKELTKLTCNIRVDFGRFSPAQQAYARFTSELWEAINKRLSTYPRFREYESLLAYDHQQIMNAMAYSCLLNRDLCLVNMVEHDAYLPHNMQMMSFATMDLMCSPDFDRRDLGRLREVIWHAQCMGRIGNLVSTWQRELSDRDFSSGVFAHALVEGELSVDELQHADSQELKDRIERGEHEAYFFRQWNAHHAAITAMQPLIKSVNVQYLLVALERLIRMELASRGFK